MWALKKWCVTKTAHCIPVISGSYNGGLASVLQVQFELIISTQCFKSPGNATIIIVDQLQL